jgi:hypothetical protein
MPMLTIRKLADTSVGERVARYDELTGEKFLVNPETNKRESWPLTGIAIENEGGPPKETAVGVDFVQIGKLEGWITLEGAEMAHFPGGPPESPWKITHSFEQADAIVIHTVDGDVRYRVVGQPGKHDDDTQESGKRVDHFYTLRLDDGKTKTTKRKGGR